MAKVLVSLDAVLLRRIDQAARARRMSRSAYLGMLAARELSTGRGPGASRQAKDAMNQLDDLFRDAPAGDAAAEIRAERDARP